MQGQHEVPHVRKSAVLHHFVKDRPTIVLRWLWWGFIEHLVVDFHESTAVFSHGSEIVIWKQTQSQRL